MLYTIKVVCLISASLGSLHSFLMLMTKNLPTLILLLDLANKSELSKTVFMSKYKINHHGRKSRTFPVPISKRKTNKFHFLFVCFELVDFTRRNLVVWPLSISRFHKKLLVIHLLCGRSRWGHCSAFSGIKKQIEHWPQQRFS